MKIWITIRPNQEEIDSLLTFKKVEAEGECKTPLNAVIDHAYALMSLRHEVTLKITNEKREYTK